jgi:broad specificity phosphatase PhoE
MSTEFVFVRHAQATHNVDAEQRGPVAYEDPIHTDAALTDTGYEQADNTVVHGPFAATYCSPLRRCRQTLLTIHPSFREVSVQLDDRLMEPTGHICNRRMDRIDVLAEIPVTWDATGTAPENPWNSTEESCEDFHQRIRDFTSDVLHHHVGERVLIVSHFQWISAWFKMFKGQSVAPANCQVLFATL